MNARNQRPSATRGSGRDFRPLCGGGVVTARCTATLGDLLKRGRRLGDEHSEEPLEESLSPQSSGEPAGLRR